MSHACCARDGSEREYCARVCSTIEACAHARPRHRHSCICHAYLCVTDAFCTSPRLRQRPASAASAIAGFTTDQSERSGCHGRPAHCAQQVWDENSMWQMRSVPTANDPQITPLLHQRFTALVTRHIRPATAKHQKTPKSNHSAIIEQHPGNIRNASNSCRPGSGKSFMWDAARGDLPCRPHASCCCASRQHTSQQPSNPSPPSFLSLTCLHLHSLNQTSSLRPIYTA